MKLLASLVGGIILSLIPASIPQENIMSSRQYPARFIPIAVLYEDVIAYPKTFDGFMEAITMWQEATKIHLKVHTVLDQHEWEVFRGLKLDIVDLPNPNMAGLFDSEINVISVDTSLENTTAVEWDTQMLPAKLIAAHEIGHALGVPHVTFSTDDRGLPTYPLSDIGDIVMENEAVARNYIMFPMAAGSKAVGISDLEADLATRAMNLPR